MRDEFGPGMSDNEHVAARLCHDSRSKLTFFHAANIEESRISTVKATLRGGGNVHGPEPE